MSVTFQSSSTGQAGLSGSIAITAPSGLASGKVMLAGIAMQGGTSLSITPPSAWNLIRRTDNGTSQTLATYYKIAGGSEPGSYTWSYSGGNGAGEGVIDAYSGVNNSTPIDTSGGQANSASTSIVAPSITVGANSGMVVGFWALAYKTAPTVASGFTSRGSTTVDSTDSCAVASGEEVFAAGATGTQTGTGASSVINEGQLISLNLAAADDESEMMQSRICM